MPRRINSISAISVGGFKSICDEQRIDIRPLTILAGANSSGKSSVMQPLLLLKQTIEAPGDPGALLLDGPNVRFTSTEQLLSKGTHRTCSDPLVVRLEGSEGSVLETHFQAKKGHGLEVVRMIYKSSKEVLDITPDMDHGMIVAALPDYVKQIAKDFAANSKTKPQWAVFRDRCFLSFEMTQTDTGRRATHFWPLGGISPSVSFVPLIQSVIHLPGLRGNPRRTYPKTAVGPHFPGTFESYVASLIFQWQGEKSNAKLSELTHNLEELGLTWKVKAEAVDDTQVEIKVGRLPQARRGGGHDLVSIADVGLGISQSLPVLVALAQASPGQLVYIEQPEIHLHPRAQRLLAHTLCRGAKRGVHLVVETHSALLLREIQTLVATGQMPEEDVRFHWFQRDEEGATTVKTAVLDANGAYGNWPADFDTTELEAEQAYLDAVEQKGKCL